MHCLQNCVCLWQWPSGFPHWSSGWTLPLNRARQIGPKLKLDFCRSSSCPITPTVVSCPPRRWPRCLCPAFAPVLPSICSTWPLPQPTSPLQTPKPSRPIPTLWQRSTQSAAALEMWSSVPSPSLSFALEPHKVRFQGHLQDGSGRLQSSKSFFLSVLSCSQGEGMKGGMQPYESPSGVNRPRGNQGLNHSIGRGRQQKTVDSCFLPRL